MGREVNGGLLSGTEISKCIKEPDPKNLFEVETTPGKWQRTTHIPAGVAGVGPRRAKPKNVGVSSTVSVAPARATTRRGRPHLCQANA